MGAISERVNESISDVTSECQLERMAVSSKRINESDPENYLTDRDNKENYSHRKI